MNSRKDLSLARSQSPELARVTLKRGREGPVAGRESLDSLAGDRSDRAGHRRRPARWSRVHDAASALIGMGYCNPATTIAIRMLAWGEAPAIEELIARRLKGALELRRRFVGEDTNAYRLVNGDGDGLWGVVVDRFGDVTVVQILTAGADRMRGGDRRGVERFAASAIDHRTQPWRGQKAGRARRSHRRSRGRTCYGYDR